ncbi:MAG: DUF1302 family protein [Porphyromonas sp.]|nr:DUF1302 family protein [Porphyromonas sp.]
MNPFGYNSVCRFLILLSLLLSLGGSGAWGQDDSSGFHFQTKGFVDTYHAVRSHSPHDFLSSRTRVRGEMNGQIGRSSFFVSLNATYNALLSKESGICLREAYIDHSEDHWALRLGRQLVIWGAADGVRITDLLSPMDLTEFLAQDYDDIRMPINALRFSLFNEWAKFDAVVVPIFEGYKLPISLSNPWSILALVRDVPGLSVKWNDATHRPTTRLSNIEYGGRLSFTFPGIDFSFSGLHTWNKMPVLETTFASPKEMQLMARYYRMGFVGADFSKPLGAFVLRGETAFNIDKHFTFSHVVPQRGFNSLNWLLGLDWYGPEDWMVSAQFSQEDIFGYRDYISQEQHASLMTLRVSKKLIENTLELSNFSYFDLNNRACFSRFAADYSLSDQIRLTLGYDFFSAKKGGMFKVFENNSELWCKARYSF